MNTALFLLRCVQLGLSILELDYLEYGEVLDMMTESANDNHKYKQIATQSDYDKF